MKNVKKLVAACMVMAALTSFVACGNSSLSKDTVLATIGQEEIRLETVDKSLFAFIEQQKKLYGNNYESKMDQQAKEELLTGRQNALDQIIIEKILLKKATDLNLIPSDEELNVLIDKDIKESIEKNFKTPEALEEAKKFHGYTDETFREFVKNNILQNLVVEYATKEITTSDEELKKFYDENKSEFVIKSGGEVKHLLFKEDSDEKSKLAADTAYNQLTTGEKSFDQLFTEYFPNKVSNKSPISEDLGFVSYSEEFFDTDFLAGMKTLKNKEFSKPIKSSFGYHIIYIDNIKAEDKQQSFDEVKSDIKAFLEYDAKFKAYTEKLTEWSKEMNVTDLSDTILVSDTDDKTTKTEK